MSDFYGANPNWKSNVYMLLGVIFQCFNEIDKAMDAYQKSLEFANKEQKETSLLGIADLLNKVKNKEKNLKLLKEVLSMNPNNLTALRRLGSYYLNNMQEAEALQVLKRIENIDSENVFIPIFKAYIHFNNYEDNEGIEILERVQKKYNKNQLNNNADIFHYLAYFYRLIGKYDDAIDFKKKYLEFIPQVPSQTSDLALIYNLKGDYEKAIEITEKDIEISPKSGLPWICHGFAKYFQGKHENGLKSAEKAIENEPYNDEIWYLYAKMLVEEEDYNGAAIACKKALELSPSFRMAKDLFEQIKPKLKDEFNQKMEEAINYIKELPNLYTKITFEELSKKTKISEKQIKQLVEDMIANKDLTAKINGNMLQFVGTGPKNDITAPEVQTQSDDAMEALIKLKELLDQGILTEEEFNEKKDVLMEKF